MRLVLYIVVLFACIMVPTHLEAKDIIVVIDPGHGGSDPGHLPHDDQFLPEKDLNLKIAKFLGGYIEKYLQNVKVVYTRTDDSFPSLDERVNLANSNNADYFISIHCNGNDRKSIRGTETHVHSMSLKKSVGLARAIEKQFSTRAGRKSRGVKDADDLKHSLQVLKYTEMTSVLVECGFVTNHGEAKYLNTTYGQEIIASAIFRGFRSTIEEEYPDIAFRKSQNSTSTTTTTTAATDQSVQYTIQIASSKVPVDATKDPQMKKAGMPVERKELNTTSAYKYIYTVGVYSSKDEANTALKAIKKRGFKDAIVIPR